MSWSALDWASKQKTGSGNTKLVLLTLANFSDDENKCFPSFKTIMNITELSRSTIIRCIKSLKQNEFIIVKERYESYLNDSHRQTSNMYYLQVGCQIDTAQYHNDTHVSITPKRHVTINNNQLYCQDFLKIWETYPRKDGSKKKAHELWYKLTKEPNSIIIKNDLLNHVVKFNKLSKNKDLKFVPHLTTWLNQRRWETVENTNEERINLNQLAG